MNAAMSNNQIKRNILLLFFSLLMWCFFSRSINKKHRKTRTKSGWVVSFDAIHMNKYRMSKAIHYVNVMVVTTFYCAYASVLP